MGRKGYLSIRMKEGNKDKEEQFNNRTVEQLNKRIKNKDLLISLFVWSSFLDFRTPTGA
jgi:hypothetical protein